VTDFGLIESIESGLVKIPFLPEADPTHDLDMPKLRNLYENVKDQLPKKGKRKSRQDQDDLKGHPQIPTLIKNAFDQFYSHYEREYENYRGLFQNPPVFIVVCNNTSVSSEIFKYLAGYEIDNKNGNIDVVNGRFPYFDNFSRDTKQLLKKPPTLLIDSDAIENSEQINEMFKKIFAPEIERFKADFRITHPDKSVENITDAEILREVVNTVGKKNRLGAHIRCVVSVSMLTEGWDANTVTHIMGLRAFGSQLLCEQVAGRALRRVNYDCFDDQGRYLPEYAQIIGVPFKFFKGGKNVQPPDPKDVKQIFAMPERQKDFQITFPNIIGYRIETIDDEIRYDFDKIQNYDLDGSKYPAYTIMSNGFFPQREKLTLEQIKEKRKQELIFSITQNLVNLYFSDENRNPMFHKFNELKNVVSFWIDHKINLIGDAFLNMLFYEDPNKVCQHIMLGVYAAQRKTDKILPVFNYYNKFGSTKYVYGNTVKEVYPTFKSHVNFVVADTESWEQICAKTLDEMDQVISYVKNAYLGFTIPYTHPEKENPFYYPDFIARCKPTSGKVINLIIEITGFNKDKIEKKWFVENRWLPAVNEVKEIYNYDEWHFIEIVNDIRDIKNQLINKINSI
jgi:type III restriction enzyme